MVMQVDLIVEKLNLVSCNVPHYGGLSDLTFNIFNNDCTFNNVSSINNCGVIYSLSDGSTDRNTINILDAIELINCNFNNIYSNNSGGSIYAYNELIF